MASMGPSGCNIEDNRDAPGLHVAAGVAFVLAALADRQREEAAVPE